MNEADKVILDNEFAPVMEWLRSFKDQVNGKAGPLTENGGKYVEFFSSQLYRPSDLLFATRNCAHLTRLTLDGYFSGKSGAIHWRIPLEWDSYPAPQVIKYDPNGPDKDFVTDQNCVMDHDWMVVKSYARAFRE